MIRSLRRHLITAAVAALGAAFAVSAAAQQPVQWNYGFNGSGVAVATYPGNTSIGGNEVVAGNLNVLGTITGSGLVPLPISGSCGTVSVSTPCLNLTQTWNGAGVAFTGLQFNVTNTASGAGSELLDLQVGGNSAFTVQSNGVVLIGGFVGSGDTSFRASTNQTRQMISPNGNVIQMGSAGQLTWTSSTDAAGTADLFLSRDAAGVLAQRNGTNAQAFRIYNTYTDASNYERGGLSWTGNTLRLGTENAGTGTTRALRLATGGTDRWAIDPSGALLTVADGTYNIGAFGANRPQDVNFTGHLATAGTTAPAVTACGTSPVVNGGASDAAGGLQAGSGTVNSCTVTFFRPYNNAPACIVIDLSAAAVMSVTQLASKMTITSAANFAGHFLAYHCMGA